MVDVIDGSNIVCKTVEIVNCSKNIINDDMLRNKVITACFKLCFKSVNIAFALFENLSEDTETYLLVNAEILKLFLGEEGNVLADINHTVGDDLYLYAFNVNISDCDACLLKLISSLFGDNLSCLSKDFSCCGACNGL